MYHYPIDSLNYFSELLTITPDHHSMNKSLFLYTDMKLHPMVTCPDVTHIIIRGYFNRSSGVSCKEKNGKLFNYMRPTATMDGSTLYINCFPGIDYVYHYGNIYNSYVSATNKTIDVRHIIPTESDCWNAIVESNLKNVPKPPTVIMGYVEGIQWISDDNAWHGDGNFLWKHVRLSSGDAILLGCKHTYWGEISGRIVSYLAMNGVRRVIYSGKLGTLNPNLSPNTTIATGNRSILPNGKIVFWNNIFEDITDDHVYYGTHITVPSVLQETNQWLMKNITVATFVDPEIGHMALAAKENNIEFSYLHIISDNLSKKYDSDLSNERDRIVLKNREDLYDIIGCIIKSV